MSFMTFDEFIKKYARLIEKLSYKFYLNGYTVDDIRQEIYMIAARVLQHYENDGKSTLTNYFMKSVYRDMVYMIRSQHGIEYGDFELLDRAGIFSFNDDTIKELEREQYLEDIWAYIDTLPKSYRARWYYKAHMNHTRIAEIEGTSHQAISSWVRRLNKHVKEQFPDYLDYM